MTDKPSSDVNNPENSDDSDNGDDASNTSTDEPERPPELPNSVIALLHTFDQEKLYAVSSYALSLAEEEGHDPDEFTVSDPENASKAQIEEYLLRTYGKMDLGAPAKASWTVKPINENDYFYWQWRDTEENKIKSEYICPVSDTIFANRDFSSERSSTRNTDESDSDSVESDDSS